MSFAFQNSMVTTLKQYRHNQHTLNVAATAAEWSKLQVAMSGVPGVKRFVFSAGAILWFESLERQEQARRVWALMTSGKKRASHNLQVLAWVGERFRAWHWPMATAAQVLAVAMFGFAELPATEQQEWFLETLIPVGVPAAPPAACAS
jgi:hypothetical protein